MPFSIDEINRLNNVNLYNILGLTKETFSPATAKKKFKKFALKYHPDKNIGNPDAERKFMMIELAYKVLSNNACRELYDSVFDEALLDEVFEEMKDIDRTKITVPLKLTADEMEKEIRRRNIEFDPDYYTVNGKISDNEITEVINNRLTSTELLSDELNEKFKQNQESLLSISDETERLKKFNEMFTSSKERKSNSQQLVVASNNRSVTNKSKTFCANMTQYDTMFSDNNEYDDSFELLNDERDGDEDDMNDMSFADYEKQYVESFNTYYEISKQSKLVNGRANYRFDEE
jgi:curved DNA-binding protein CbpA